MEEEGMTIVVDVPSSAPSNWEDYEKLFQHGFYNELRMAPEEHRLIVTESIFTNPANREKLAQMMFETYCVPCLALIPTALASLYANGITTTGLSIHAGETCTEIVPVINGTPRRDLAVEYPISGSYITGYAQKLIQVAKPDYSSGLIKDYAEQLKRSMFVALDPASQPEKTEELEFSDGSKFDLGKNSWLPLEMFFYPELASEKHSPLVQTILEIINACPTESKSELLDNIVLSGGVAGYPGIQERLQKDLDALLKGFPVQATVRGEQIAKSLPWVGASVAGCSQKFDSCFMSREHYDEVGPTGIHSFCV
jgi:actin